MPPPGGKDWAGSLQSASAALRDDELIVSVSRPLARSALAHPRAGSLVCKGPGPAEVKGSLREGEFGGRGMAPWPSARSPRIAFLGATSTCCIGSRPPVCSEAGAQALGPDPRPVGLVHPVAAALAPGNAFVVRQSGSQDPA